LVIQSLRLWVTIKPIATPVLWILGISAAVGALATYFTTTTIAAAIFNVAFILVTLIAVCLVISKERNRALQVEQRNSELFHIVSENIHNAHHLIRDALFDLEHADAGIVRERAKNTAKDLVNLLAGLLSKLTGCYVCVCIKIPEQFEGVTARSIDDLEGKNVLTFCRDRINTPGKRWEQWYHSLVDNSVFRDIILGKIPYFTSADLEKEKDYTNMTPNWRQWYKTAIVVPIRRTVSHSDKGNPKYELLGFLCADSLTTEAFGEKQIDDYAQLLMSVGDGLYLYFDEVRKLDA
jgi:hypothetical protein